MGKQNIWDILAWIAFAIMVLYAFGKIIGVINNPLPIDIVALLSVAYFVGKYAKKIDYTNKEVSNNSKKMEQMSKDVWNMSTKVETATKDIEDIKSDILHLDKNCPLFRKQRTRTK